MPDNFTIQPRAWLFFIKKIKRLFDKITNLFPEWGSYQSDWASISFQLQSSMALLFSRVHPDFHSPMNLLGTRCSYRWPCNSSDKKSRNFLSVKLASRNASYMDEANKCGGKRVRETGIEKAVFGWLDFRLTLVDFVSTKKSPCNWGDTFSILSLHIKGLCSLT